MKTEQQIKDEIERLDDELFSVTMSLKSTGGQPDKNLERLLKIKELEAAIKYLQWVIL